MGAGNDPGDFIQINAFIKAMEMVLNDSRLDPYNLVYKLLLTFFSGQQKIRPEQLDEFFQRFDTYFVEGDRKLFFEECSLLIRGGTIDIKEVAAMINNEVEMFPR